MDDVEPQTGAGERDRRALVVLLDPSVSSDGLVDALRARGLDVLAAGMDDLADTLTRSRPAAVLFHGGGPEGTKLERLRKELVGGVVWIDLQASPSASPDDVASRVCGDLAVRGGGLDGVRGFDMREPHPSDRPRTGAGPSDVPLFSDWPAAAADPLDPLSVLREDGVLADGYAGRMSEELEQLLASAEQQLDQRGRGVSPPSSRESDADLRIDEQWLSALDEPLDQDDDVGTGSSVAMPAQGRHTTGAKQRSLLASSSGGDAPGSGGGSTGVGSPAPPNVSLASSTGRIDLPLDTGTGRFELPLDKNAARNEGRSSSTTTNIPATGFGTVADGTGPGRYMDTGAGPTSIRGGASRSELHGDGPATHVGTIAEALSARPVTEPGPPSRAVLPPPLESLPPDPTPQLPPVVFRPAQPSTRAWNVAPPRSEAAGASARAWGEIPPTEAAPAPPPHGRAEARPVLPEGRAEARAVKTPSQDGAVAARGVVDEAEAVRVIARAVSNRVSGSLAIEASPGSDARSAGAGSLRRILLRDGDVVTSESTAPDETLLGFLILRGDLAPEVAQKLGAKLPASGRHAGAALVAHGHIRQDQLWPVLRAHAEWIIGRALVASGGSYEIEDNPPQRLTSEPSVFGGATGAEVFVESVRRVIHPDVAAARLGGRGARVVEGRHAALLAECALPRPEHERFARATEKTLGELVDEAGGPEMASVVYALTLLEVCDVRAPVSREAAAAEITDDPLDDEAVRARVRARMQLVREGDYFAVLGVPRDATPYEIRRAYLELRRGAEPSRVLTARTADLLDDLRTIVEVLDEAYEILRDPHRRDRYRRAIEDLPPER